MEPKLISFEGLDGTGKTTQVLAVLDCLTRARVPFSTYREPGGTPLGENIRQWLKEGRHKGAISELLLFITARAELVETLVKPDLEQGRVVVLDRFTDSSFAYQGALGVPEEVLLAACRLGAGGLEPALTIWLDAEPTVALGRRNGAAGGAASAVDGIDAIERRDLDYFERVRDRYTTLADRHQRRIVRIDAGQPLASVTHQVCAIVLDRLGITAPSQREVA